MFLFLGIMAIFFWVLAKAGARKWVLSALAAGAVLFCVMVFPQTLGAIYADLWTFLAFFGVVPALLIGYIFFLNRVQKRAHLSDNVVPKKSNTMTATELDRYARHIVLREVGGPGQQKLRAAKVLVVGAGGLGSPVLMYLAAAGVGRLGVIDDDQVSLSNLQRQVIFDTDQIDLPKVQAAQTRINRVNPHVEVFPYERRLTAKFAEELVAEYDLVVDGCDNFATRSLVNVACVATQTPLISGAISQWEGQVSVFDPAREGPCYACVFPNEPDAQLIPTCAEAGVVGALPGVVGSMMALETIKQITGAGQVLRGEMLIFDGLFGENRKVVVAKRKGCPVCGDRDLVSETE